jgi:pilus assembly protein Flp/PilA
LETAEHLLAGVGKKKGEDMNTMKFSARKYCSEERGATSIEYALLGAGIAVAIIAAVTAMGETLFQIYDDVSVQLIAAQESGE